MTGDLTRSHWDAVADADVLRPTTVGDVLVAAAAEHPERVALIAGVPEPSMRRRWTYAELLADASRMAGWFAERTSPGERVAIWAPSEPEWVIAQFAAAFCGLVVVPLNPDARPAEARVALEASGAAVLIHGGEHRGNDIAGHVDALRPDLSSLRIVLPIEAVGAVDATPLGAADRAAVRPDDLSQIQFTSGTTGTPKGVCLHHGGITNNARLMLTRQGLVDGDTYLNVSPMYHLGGSGLGSVGVPQFHGTHVLAHHFSPALVLELVETLRVTATGGVPTMLAALLDHPDFAHRDMSSLRVVSSGGSTVPPALVRRIEEQLGVAYVTMYGQTEASPGLTQTALDDGDVEKAETVGTPLPHVSLRIVDPTTGETVPIGTPGEIVARSPMVMLGYWDDPDRTAEALDDDGWLHTGDLGTMDADGRCRVVGRIREMIVRGGENISPREIEAALEGFPGVAEVAVVGVPDARYGQTVAAFVRPAGTFDLDALRAHASTVLARHKVPQWWRTVDALPLTVSGKVRKNELVAWWAADMANEHDGG